MNYAVHLLYIATFLETPIEQNLFKCAWFCYHSYSESPNYNYDTTMSFFTDIHLLLFFKEAQTKYVLMISTISKSMYARPILHNSIKRPRMLIY